MNLTPISVKRDSYRRSQLFHPDSFKHNGKMNLNLISVLLQSWPAGSLIVDPMAGTGSTLLALDYQHPVVVGELEAHWCDVANANRKIISGRRLLASTTPGLVARWDAAALPLAANSAPFILTSPPYWDMLSDWHIKSKNLKMQGHELYGPAYGVDPRNVGNVHIYEAYLREMSTIYAECWRVLGPGAIMALVVKDRVHKKRRVPIVRDTVGLCTALGFQQVETLTRDVVPSLYRRINTAHHPDAPTVSSEQVLVFRKMVKPGPKRRFAVLQAPKPNSKPSLQLFQKAHTHTLDIAHFFVLDATGLTQWWHPADIRSPHHVGFRRRKEFVFDACHQLVTKYGFAAGDEIEFHGSMKYGQYLQQRVLTFGGSFSNPTEGLNLGQKLKWYTEAQP